MTIDNLIILRVFDNLKNSFHSPVNIGTDPANNNNIFSCRIRGFTSNLDGKSSILADDPKPGLRHTMKRFFEADLRVQSSTAFADDCFMPTFLNRHNLGFHVSRIQFQDLRLHVVQVFLLLIERHRRG